MGLGDCVDTLKWVPNRIELALSIMVLLTYEYS